MVAYTKANPGKMNYSSGGYGTPAHLAALKAHGPCPFHRHSFAPVRAAAGEATPSEAPNLFNL